MCVGVCSELAFLVYLGYAVFSMKWYVCEMECQRGVLTWHRTFNTVHFT